MFSGTRTGKDLYQGRFNLPAATREQQASLFVAGGILHTEPLPVPGTILQSPGLSRIREYLTPIIRDTEVSDTDET